MSPVRSLPAAQCTSTPPWGAAAIAAITAATSLWKRSSIRLYPSASVVKSSGRGAEERDVGVGDAVVGRLGEGVGLVGHLVGQPQVDDGAHLVADQGLTPGRGQSGQAAGAHDRAPAGLASTRRRIAAEVAGVQHAFPCQPARPLPLDRHPSPSTSPCAETQGSHAWPGELVSPLPRCALWDSWHRHVSRKQVKARLLPQPIVTTWTGGVIVWASAFAGGCGSAAAAG